MSQQNIIRVDIRYPCPMCEYTGNWYHSSQQLGLGRMINVSTVDSFGTRCSACRGFIRFDRLGESDMFVRTTKSRAFLLSGHKVLPPEIVTFGKEHIRGNMTTVPTR